MAISQAVCNTFKRDLLKGFHDFASGGSTFKIALYTSSASLGASTEDYSTSNEITIKLKDDPNGAGLQSQITSGTNIRRRWRFYDLFDGAPGTSLRSYFVTIHER